MNSYDFLLSRQMTDRMCGCQGQDMQPLVLWLSSVVLVTFRDSQSVTLPFVHKMCQAPALENYLLIVPYFWVAKTYYSSLNIILNWNNSVCVGGWWWWWYWGRTHFRQVFFCRANIPSHLLLLWHIGFTFTGFTNLLKLALNSRLF